MFWDPMFVKVSELVGVGASEIKMLSAMLLSYPLASLYYRIPAAQYNLAHLYSIAVTLFFMIPLLGVGSGFLHLVADVAVTYGIIVSRRGADMPWMVFGVVMTHLLTNHLYNTIVGLPEGVVDITFSQMVLLQKLTTIAWNVHDGRRKPEDLDEAQRSTRLHHVPTPLAFLGYCFFFPSVLVGPHFDYVTYDALIKHTLYTAPPGATREEQTKASYRKPYGRKRVAYLHLGLGLLFMAIFGVLGGKASYARMLDDDWYAWKKTTRFGFVQFAGLIARTKYYGAWSLSEGACILTGIGFNGYDPKTGRTLWNRVKNVQILRIETAESFKVLFDSWNCGTNIWLRDCIYKRLVAKGLKPGTRESMFTFLTSAIWHGIWPGYYLAFVTAGLVTSIGKSLRRFVRPYFLPAAVSPSAKDATTQRSADSPNSLPQYPYPNLTKRAYDLLGWMMVQINLNYLASSFLLLDFKKCIKAYHRMGWYSHALIVLTMVFFQSGGRRYLRKDLEKRGLLQKAPARKPDSSSKTASDASIRRSDSVPSVQVSPPSPQQDERSAHDLKWVKQALEDPPVGARGQGHGPDGDWVDDVLRGMETPGMVGTPKSERSFNFKKDN